MRLRLRPVTASIAVMVLGFALTYQLWAFFNTQARNELNRLFLIEADLSVERFLRQLEDFEQQLEAIRALFAASVVVDREEFSAFVDTLQLQKTNPGVRASGYITYFKNTDQARFVYIFPTTSENVHVIGRDAFESESRKMAMITAMKTDRAMLSGPLIQLQDDSQNAVFGNYLFYMPIFQNLLSYNDKNGKRQALGWAYIAIDMRESLASVLLSVQVNLTHEVFDTTDQANPVQVYGVAGHSYPKAHERKRVQDAFRTIEAFGRIWTVKTISTSDFEKRHQPSTQRWVAFFGITATLFLAVLSWLLVDRTAALRHIKRINRKLTVSEQKWKFALEGSGDGMWDYDLTHQTNQVSAQGKALLGYQPDELGISIDEWKNHIHPEDEARVTQALEDYINGRNLHYRIEHRLKCKDGDWKWFLARGIGVEYDDHGNVTRMIGTITDISHMKASEEIIWRQANFDALTGLPNRRMFFDRLEHEIRRAQRYGHGFALVFIDLDNFKEINDSYGHQAGDHALVVVADRLKNVVRASDTVARLGGDEFTLILSEVTTKSDVLIVLRKVLSVLLEPIQLKSVTVTISASMGIACCPEDAATSDDLLNKADRAMYQAKEAGKNEWRFHH
ncbi:MAG: diguanylate cyclase [Pusillimonas sp.]|nr:diguanylate cyclase [Pusillimonas sp.]